MQIANYEHGKDALHATFAIGQIERGASAFVLRYFKGQFVSQRKAGANNFKLLWVKLRHDGGRNTHHPFIIVWYILHKAHMDSIEIEILLILFWILII